jgi:3-dehydroquinate dehydratase-1
MVAGKRVKNGGGPSFQTVGVITTMAGLDQAALMAAPPDLFELRLDHLIGCEKTLPHQIRPLASPLIITARSPAEGGANHLRDNARRELLIRFLERAAFVDVELCSARALGPVLKAALEIGVGRILSFHDFTRGPVRSVLQAKLRAAQRLHADILKIVVRTDRMDEIARLAEFTTEAGKILNTTTMGIGKLGLVSRVILAGAGSCMIYGAIGRRRVPGQPTLVELRCALGAQRPRIK